MILILRQRMPRFSLQMVFAGLFLLLLVSCGSDEPPAIKIGDKAPGFTLKDLQGKTVELSGYKGSPVVLRFFLTDCKFCQADTPAFNEYYKKYADKGLGMFYIDTLGVEQKKLTDFVRQFDLAFPVLLDPGAKVAAQYRVRALPQTMVLDPDHKIIAAILGGVSEAELDNLLHPYLDNTRAPQVPEK